MVIVNAYHRTRVVVPNDVVAQRAHPAQRVHPRDRIARHFAARHHADVPGAPDVPGDETAGRVRAHVRDERVGGHVQRLLLLDARVAAAPAVADDVQDDESVREIGAEAAGGMAVGRRVRHRVLRDGEVAGRRRSGHDFREVQAQDGSAGRMDVFDYQIRVVCQGFTARIEYVIGIQEFVTEG